MTSSRIRPVRLLAAAALALLTATSGFTSFVAHAGGAAAKFSDPADRVKSRMSGDSGDKTRIQNGNTTLQFGGRSTFDERNNADRYFSPNNLMGR
ncbi:MAG: hypothetical protein PSV22_17980 [Pseudolabrys sp.]|nr:hypothetical protein [Pseudolabrys sp.]